MDPERFAMDLQPSVMGLPRAFLVHDSPSNPAATATGATPPEPVWYHPEWLNKLKKRATRAGSSLGNVAPPIDIHFPVNANFTAVELLTFFPLLLQMSSVINRLITNGGTRKAIWAIVNTHRELVTEWSQNTCGNWMYKAMREAGLKGWTVTKHHTFGTPGPDSHPWFENDLSPTSFADDVLRARWKSADILFKDLATGVRQMPTGEDALDLTRMVQYCVENPEEPWLYPRDYDVLLRRQLGGSATIREGHLDRAAFARWEGISPPAPSLAPPDLPPDEHKAPKQKKVKRDNVKTSSLETTPELVTSGLESESEDARHLFTWDSSNSTTLSPPAVQPEIERQKGILHQAVESGTQAVAKSVVHGGVAGPGQYICQPAEYVAPPKDTGTEPTHEEIELAFAKERIEGESDTRSPYAFGGPRVSPPYRMLHKIRQPHPEDKTSWAENLRWHFEQSACFGFTYRADEWNESPEHMELIAEARNRQSWVSDELIELEMTEEDRDETAQFLG